MLKLQCCNKIFCNIWQKYCDNISIAMNDWKYFWHVSAIFCAMWGPFTSTFKLHVIAMIIIITPCDSEWWRTTLKKLMSKLVQLRVYTIRIHAVQEWEEVSSTFQTGHVKGWREEEDTFMGSGVNKMLDGTWVTMRLEIRRKISDAPVC